MPSGNNQTIDPAPKEQAGQWMKSQPVWFLENKGQMTDMEGKPVPFVLFKAEAPGMNMYITEKGLTYLFIKAEEEKKETTPPASPLMERGVEWEREENIKISWARVDMELKGASIKKENIVKENASITDFNFFYPHCPDGIYGVKEYEKITIREIYPGIDWVFYNSTQKGYKYDFVVHPGANPHQIKLVYCSEEKLSITPEGAVKIRTPYGELTELSPKTFLEGHPIESCFKHLSTARNNNGGYDVTIGFDLGTWDLSDGIRTPSLCAEGLGTLTIDPALWWATFYGGSYFDGPSSTATDGAGNVFVTAYTNSTNFFPTLNPSGGAYFQGNLRGMNDFFILKFSNTGVLLWATYYGGSGDDYGNSITTDASGNVFLIGFTQSSNLPTLNPGGGVYFQSANAGGWDICILKFSNTSVPLWATYYGGNVNEWWDYSIAVDASGNILVTGATNSINFPTLNPGGGAYFQGAIAGAPDAFILKFSNTGVRILATYYGGSENELGYSITTDATGNVFVTGYTSSINFPTQNPGGGAYFQVANAGISDAFILKFSSTGVPLWATYYGGSGDERGYSIAADATGNVFVTGYTTSTNFPTLNSGGGAYFQGANAGGEDAFILKFSNTSVPFWATYYGGNQMDIFGSSKNLALDGCSNVVVSFITKSPNISVQAPCDGNYYDNTYNGEWDIAILKFSNTGVRLWATYFGGDGADFRESMALDGNGNLFIAGEWGDLTNSATYPVTNPGGGAYYDATFNGLHDGYIAKFLCAPCDCAGSCASILTVTASSVNILCNGQCTGTATTTPTNGTSPYTYYWNNGQTTQTATGLCAGNYTVTVTDSAPTTVTATVAITQPTAITAAATSTAANCGNNNGTATVTASGGTSPYTYLWSSGGQTNSTATGLGAGNYTATITDTNGCSATQTVTVTPGNVLNVTVTSTQTGCAANTGTSTATPGNGTAPYTYNWSSGQTTQTATGLGAGTYTVTVSDASGCIQTQTINVTQTPGPTVVASASPNSITTGASTTLTASGGGTYSWSPSTGLSCITCSSPIVFPSGTTMYCVTVTDSNGCSDSACVTVMVELDCSNAEELYLPNAFSPNNDGENDKLQIYYRNIKCIKTFKLVIYNRWGEKVFETMNATFQWDGASKEKISRVLGTAVFVYYMETTLISGGEIISKGNISLIR